MRPGEIIDKHAIKVLYGSISICHDVVVAFGAIVFLQAKKCQNLLPFFKPLVHCFAT